MSIPTFDKMLRPILELATKMPVTRRVAWERMAEHFELSDEERAAVTPTGGQTLVANRSGWAMSFLTKGGLIEKVAPRQYKATEAGRSFLLAHPAVITVKDLERIEGWEEAWNTRKKGDGSASVLPDLQVSTPQDSLDHAIASIHGEVRAGLTEAILKQSPAFFERLVLDVLLAMGYGGSREEAVLHLGKSGDEGIDGRINQDPLGLDQILVQAKRNAPDNVIDRKTIQAFIGSMTGQGVTKGVFITTSSFAASAKEFVQRGSNTKVVLIDGDALLDLMMRHHIGVRVEREIEILDLDQNYFEDES
ncbi:MAG: restriction endonuclease [Acidobacteriota bacterium]